MNLLSSTFDQNELKRTECTLLPKIIKKKKTETAVVKTLDIGAEMENKRGEHCDCTLTSLRKISRSGTEKCITRGRGWWTI